MKRILLAAACVALMTTAAHAEPTFAERLGWPEGTRALIIHADDAGMSLAANNAIIEGIEAGTITSFSTMMTCSWVPHINDWLKENPDFCAGLHLTFTSEWGPYKWGPVAGRDAVPGLVNEDGWMHHPVSDVVANATPDEIEKEMRAQIALARRMGHPITHLDSHMGTLFASMQFFERYMKVAIEEQIPMLIAGGHLTRAREGNPEATRLLQMVVPTIWNAGLPVLDDIDTSSYSMKSADKLDEVIEVIRNLPPGITWFNVHPTKPTEEGITLSNNRELLWGDYYALIDPRLMEVIEEEGIVLTSWKELMERRQAVGDSIQLK